MVHSLSQLTWTTGSATPHHESKFSKNIYHVPFLIYVLHDLYSVLWSHVKVALRYRLHWWRGRCKRHLQGCTSFSLSTSISLNLSFTLCQSSSGLMSVADRWQSHFHSGVVPCYLGAKPCNSYKCHIKSRPGRWEWQSDREASHNRYYLHLCGGTPTDRNVQLVCACADMKTCW